MGATKDKRRRRFTWIRRVLLVFGSLLVSGVTIGLVGRSLVLREADKRLRAAEAEADRLDPGWRWDELQARREENPPEPNAADRVIAAAALLPEGLEWPTRIKRRLSDGSVINVALAEKIGQRSPAERLDEQLSGELRTELERVKPALQEARQLIETPRGRFAIEWARDFMSTSLKGVQQSRQVVRLLQFEAVLAAQEGNLKRAVLASRAAFNASRSAGDEPVLLVLLVRVACMRMVLMTLERTLAQGELTENDLAILQGLLEDECKTSFLVDAVRGERAMLTAMLGRIVEGEFQLEDLSARGKPQAPGALTQLYQWAYVRPLVHFSRSKVLDVMTAAVEIAKRDPVDQMASWEGWEENIRTLSDTPSPDSFTLRLIPAVPKAVTSYQRYHACLHCARAALAAERFRLEHQRWPRNLEELVPHFLTAVSKDPFADGPLRSRRTEEGLIIYSVGPDGEDDEGAVAMPLQGYPPDEGFRLWDLAKRRQPPSPEPVEP